MVLIIPVVAKAFAKEIVSGSWGTNPSSEERLESDSESELDSESDIYGLYFGPYILLFMYEVLFLAPEHGSRGQTKV